MPCVNLLHLANFLLLTGGARSRSTEAAFAVCPQVFLLSQGWPDQSACSSPSGKISCSITSYDYLDAGFTARVESGGRETPDTRGCKQADGNAAGNYPILNGESDCSGSWSFISPEIKVDALATFCPSLKFILAHLKANREFCWSCPG